MDKKQMDGWMESKKIDEAIDGWMYRKDKWMVECIVKNIKIAGWLDGQENQKDGWMDIKKCMDRKKNGWTDKTNRWMVGRKTKLLKNRQIPKWKIGWIEKYGWLDG